MKDRVPAKLFYGKLWNADDDFRQNQDTAPGCAAPEGVTERKTVDNQVAGKMLSTISM